MQKRDLDVDDVVRILIERDVDDYPVATSTYVAEEAGVSRPTALDRLKEGKEEGRIKGTQVGQASVWWAADDPITAKHADGIDVVEVPAPDDAVEEPVADGAVGGAVEEVQQLLQTNRELIQETRARRRQVRNLRRPTFLIAAGIVAGFVDSVFPVPQAFLALAGFMMLIGTGVLLWRLSQAPAVIEPEP